MKPRHVLDEKKFFSEEGHTVGHLAQDQRVNRNDSPVLILDGTRMQLVPPDIDGDGIVGGVEDVTRHADMFGGRTEVQQKTELGESMDKLDADRVDENTLMSEIDFNANLNGIEKNCFGVLDFLVSIHFLPNDVQYLSRRMKRLSVSVGGKGREQKVAMVTGQREHQRGMGSLMDRVKSVFTKSEE